MDDHEFEETFIRKIYNLFTHFSEMSVFGSYWETWYFVVCEYSCSCGHKMDKIFWLTLGAFDPVHSSYRQYLHVGNTAQQCRLGLFQDSDFAAHVCANKLAVQETDFSFAQFCRSWLISLDASLRLDGYSRSHSLGFVDWSISFRTEQNRWTQERAKEKPVGSCEAKHV